MDAIEFREFCYASIFEIENLTPNVVIAFFQVDETRARLPLAIEGHCSSFMVGIALENQTQQFAKRTRFFQRDFFQIYLIFCFVQCFSYSRNTIDQHDLVMWAFGDSQIDAHQN